MQCHWGMRVRLCGCILLQARVCCLFRPRRFSHHTVLVNGLHCILLIVICRRRQFVRIGRFWGLVLLLLLFLFGSPYHVQFALNDYPVKPSVMGHLTCLAPFLWVQPKHRVQERGYQIGLFFRQ